MNDELREILSNFIGSNLMIERIGNVIENRFHLLKKSETKFYHKDMSSTVFIKGNTSGEVYFVEAKNEKA